MRKISLLFRKILLFFTILGYFAKKSLYLKSDFPAILKPPGV